MSWGPDEELAECYRQFRGRPAPVTEYTEALWAQIAVMDAYEVLRG